MELQVQRYSDNGDSTLGLLFEKKWDRKMYKLNFLCFTIEDEERTVKIFGETRISEGKYRILLRTEGTFHKNYTLKYQDMHKGMLWLQDVPNFEYVLIHTGNDDEDTAGCLLVGDKGVQNITEPGATQSSVRAYMRIYPPIAKAILNNEEVWIEYKDITEHYF